MAFGREHINVSQIMGLDRLGLVPERRGQAGTNTNALITSIRNLVSPPPGIPPGGYLYFPPGRYFLGRPDTAHAPASVVGGEFGDIVVPANVTLWFAPGAVLVPMAGADVAPSPLDQIGELVRSVRIEIHGDIIAERRQIFAVWLDENDPARYAREAQKAGVVLLLGDRVREVYPEWWGASPEKASQNPAKNVAAIQAAIDAAYHRRLSPKRGTGGVIEHVAGTTDVVWIQRPSIPVVLMGEYYINSEIHVGVSQDWISTNDPLKQPPLSGFELEGERAMGGSGGGRPSLQAGANFEGRALLAIRGPTMFSIRNMTFDGHYEALSCVTVETIDPARGSAIIDGCSFLRASLQPGNPGASTALVVLDAETRRRSIRPGVSPANAPRDYWNISFKRCLLSPGDILPLQPSDTPRSLYDSERLANRIRDRVVDDVANNVVGVEVRLGDNEGLEFRECIFRDAGSPGIRAFSGRFAMRNCLMHMSRPHRLGPSDRGVDPGVWSSERVNGMDYSVHADWSSPDHPHGADIIVEEPRVRNPASGAVPLIPASFTLNTHMSHSWQLFAAQKIRPDMLGVCKPSPVVLMDVKSVLEKDLVSARELDPPSVFWPEGGPGSIGSPLVLIGCEFRGLFQSFTERVLTPEERLHYVRVVVVGGGMLGPIFNLGTQLISTNGTFGAEGLNEAVRGSSAAILPRVRQLRARMVG